MEEKNSEEVMETENIEEQEEVKVVKKTEVKLEKFQLDKLRGRVIIFNPEGSEFAKNLNLTKKGDYTQKKQ